MLESVGMLDCGMLESQMCGNIGKSDGWKIGQVRLVGILDSWNGWKVEMEWKRWKVVLNGWQVGKLEIGIIGTSEWGGKSDSQALLRHLEGGKVGEIAGQLDVRMVGMSES